MAASRILSAALLALSLLVIAPQAWAAKVKNVKGKRVLVDTENEPVSVGQIYNVVKNGRTIGVIKITRVRNNQVLAVLGKGRAEPGASLRERRARTARSGSRRSSETTTAAALTHTSYLGGLIGITMASSEVKLQNDPTVSLSGQGFSAKGLFDYQLFGSFWFRGLAGLEQFIAGGANGPTDCRGECTIEIAYLTMDFWARWLMSMGTFRPWIGGGGALLFPLQKDSTAIADSTITNTNIFAVGAGFDWVLPSGSFLPVQVEYQIYPKSNTVTANAIAARVGIGMPF